uniref:Uncharacterized protein n=1 Tax=Meloidogyne enterolobii TaxID=390850 RepID=A0A6V7U1P5_MELEN|nr:unnamed protein product [Meloidogyne enterolobii]
MYHIARFDCTRKMPDFKFWRFSQKKFCVQRLYLRQFTHKKG